MKNLWVVFWPWMILLSFAGLVLVEVHRQTQLPHLPRTILVDGVKCSLVEKCSSRVPVRRCHDEITCKQ